LDAPTYAGLETDVGERGVPEIIHFDGHGNYGRLCRVCKSVTTPLKAEACRCAERLGDEQPQGYLFFEDRRRLPDPVGAQEFARFLLQ
jgi:hypothetical protein